MIKARFHTCDISTGPEDATVPSGSAVASIARDRPEICGGILQWLRAPGSRGGPREAFEDISTTGIRLRSAFLEF